ncbi:MAG: HAD-IA family hydrolase [Opitutales bacterium]
MNADPDFSRIRAVSFDAGGTLIVPHPSVGTVYARILREHGIQADQDILDRQFGPAFAAAEQASPTGRDADGERRFWQDVVKATVTPYLKADREPERFVTVFDAMYEAFAHGDAWRLRQGALRTLDTLRRRGYRLVLLSNTDARLRRVLDDLALTGRFEALFLSVETGAGKPDPLAFETVRAWLDLPADNILHVGDSVSKDGRGATGAGWQACLVHRNTGRYAGIPWFPELEDLLEHLDGPEMA